MRKIVKFFCVALVLVSAFFMGLSLLQPNTNSNSSNTETIEYVTPSDNKYGTNMWYDTTEKEDNGPSEAVQIVIYCAIALIGGGCLAFIIVKYVKDIRKIKEAKKEEENDDQDESSNS